MGGNVHRRVPPSVQRAARIYGLLANSQLQQLTGDFYQRLADAADVQSIVALVRDYCVKRFSMVAELLLPLSVSKDPGAINPRYESELCREEQKLRRELNGALRPCPRERRKRLRADILLRFQATKLQWLAEAKRRHLECHPLPTASSIRERARKRERSGAGTRRERVDRFLRECNREAREGEKVLRTHLWRFAGHTSSRQFEYWQKPHEKATRKSSEKFERVLAMPPAKFLTLLRGRDLLTAR